MPIEADEKAQLSNEMKQIKEDLAKLQKDLSQTLRVIGDQGKEKFWDAYEGACNYGKTAVDASRKLIEDRPVQSLLVAFVAGVIVSKLLDRK